MPIKMSKRLDTKPVIIETESVVFDKGKNRPVMVTISKRTVGFTLKGLRNQTPVIISPSGIYMKGQMQ